jgi:nucleotide-binding universal stress UspA family protein
MIRRVLVGTDFSETSEGALRWGIEIARAHGAEVALVHALRLPSLATPYVPIPPDLDVELERKATDRLEQVARQFAADGRKIETQIRHDEPAAALREAATTWNADLVVIGTRGQSRLEHLLLGSVAERVIAVSPVPVLSVHYEDFDRHRPLRRILVPTDFSEESRRSAGVALDLLGARGKGELILVHAYHLPIEYSAYGALPTNWNFVEEAEKASKRELDEWAGELSASGWQVTAQVAEGTAPFIVERLARELAVDLIAMGTHGRGALRELVMGSVAKRVVQHAPCPVLTVRRREQATE